MNLRRILFPAICLFALSATAADDLKPLRKLGNDALTAFEDHRDSDGQRLFQDFKQKVNASDTALRDSQIEIILGVLGCAVGNNDDKEMGRAALDYVLEYGKGIQQIRTTLKQVRAACAGSQPVNMPAASTMDFVLVSASGGPGVSGKGGFMMTEPVPSVAVTAISAAELENRLKETEDPATALKPVLARFPGHGTVTEHFIVASDGNQAFADGVATCLERYRVIIGREFDMLTPAHRITVYDSQWDDRIYQEARHLHGLQLPPGTIAYSVYADLSMVGEGAPQGCGSLAHELTHLMIRNNFADAPAWLEEGLASAVALSVPEGDHLTFGAGWRDDVLRTRWGFRPTVEQLLSLTWDDFAPATNVPMQRVNAVQAMASVFARYLASQGKLEKVYFAVRGQDLTADLRNHSTREQVVEKELGKSLADVDSDFAAWFKKEPMDRRPITREASSKPCEPSPANTVANAANTVANAVVQGPIQQQAPMPCETDVKKK